MKKKITCLLLNLAICNAFAIGSEEKTAEYFKTIQKNTLQLEKFLEKFPKGADLHNHVGGGSMAENLIKYAKSYNLCVDPKSYKVGPKQNCKSPWFLNTLSDYPDLYDALIDAWTMRNFDHSGKESGRDHFFHAFGKFSYIKHRNTENILAEIVQRGGTQNTVYLELISSGLDKGKASALSKTVKPFPWKDEHKWENNFKKLHSLLEGKIQPVSNQILASAKKNGEILNKKLQCSTTKPKAGCKVDVRYLYTVLRMSSTESVFTQLYAGFMAASKDKNYTVVGINMAQPEDNKISMRDYKLHMKMVEFFHKMFPKVHITLHAGELRPGLVPDEGLRSHIRDAVSIAHAERIGHGADIMHEDNHVELLDTMAKKKILVEINLSSNDGILNMRGVDHPLPLYIQHKVPVALSTDDEGITRSILSKEYQRAVESYQFSYNTLKTLSRNSLEYSFLPGSSLWIDTYQNIRNECRNDKPGAEKPGNGCADFLKKNVKAKLQWDLEKRFNIFENQY